MCSQSVQFNVDINQNAPIVIELPKPYGLDDETKKIIKYFAGSGCGQTDPGCLEGFFKLLSGCGDSYLMPGLLRGSHAFYLLFSSLPDYPEKVSAFMKFYAHARSKKYSLNFRVILFNAIASDKFKTPGNNRKAFVNAYDKAMMIALAVFVDQVAKCHENLIEMGDEWEKGLKNIIEGIAKNFADIWCPENISALMKQVESVKKYLSEGMNIAQRIILKHMINDLIYKMYIHMTHKPLTASNKESVIDLLKMSCEAGLISENEKGRFYVYLNHVAHHCWGCGCDEKYKAIALMFGYSNGLSMKGLIDFIN